MTTNQTGATPMTTYDDTTTYSHDDGSPYSERETVTVNRTASNLMDGSYFRLHANSLASAPHGGPPAHRDDWSHAVTTLGRMAAESDGFAQLASAIIAGLPLYQTTSELHAKVWANATAALGTRYDDVIGRAGPEPGRYSDHQHDWTLAERIELAYWLTEATAKHGHSVPTVGWCVSALARHHQVRVPRDARKHEAR